MEWNQYDEYLSLKSERERRSKTAWDAADLLILIITFALLTSRSFGYDTANDVVRVRITPKMCLGAYGGVNLRATVHIPFNEQNLGAWVTWTYGNGEENRKFIQLGENVRQQHVIEMKKVSRGPVLVVVDVWRYPRQRFQARETA